MKHIEKRPAEDGCEHLRNTPEINVDALVADLESRGLGWDVGHTGRLREARIWHWPHVVGRYRPNEPTPLVDMLAKAMYEVDFEYYTKLAPGEEIKTYYRTHG